MIVFRKGHRFEGPDGQGYELTCDVEWMQTVEPHQFKPFGGAPEPVVGERVQEWLWMQQAEQISEILKGREING